MKRTVVLLLFCLAFFPLLNAQEGEEFDVTLDFDYSAAEQTLQLYQDEFVNVDAVAESRGNRIAASTTGMIAANGASSYLLKSYLDSLKYRQYIQNDVYKLNEAKQNSAAIRELLDEMKKRNFNKKVMATVEQIFPRDVAVSTRIPVYVVALGHENVDAFVRRIVWRGDEPQFTNDDSGELTIVVNLAQAIRYSDKLEGRFIELLGVVAHEVFHAAFGVYKDESRVWKQYYIKYQRPFDYLLDLVHNEGIAYHLSMEQQWGDYLPQDWNSKMREVFIKFNANAKELLSKQTKPARMNEIIRTANMSGFWDSYGSMAGMYMARTIDKQAGRESLIKSISFGPNNFFRAYIKLTKSDAGLPALDPAIVRAISRKK